LYASLTAKFLLETNNTKSIEVKAANKSYQYYAYRHQYSPLSAIVFPESLFCKPVAGGTEYFRYQNLEEKSKGSSLINFAILALKESAIHGLNIFGVRGTGSFITEEFANILTIGKFNGFQLYECKKHKEDTCPIAPEIKIMN